MRQLKTVGLIVWRSGLVAVGVITLAVLFAVVWLERILRLLTPAIFSALPEAYRRILLQLVTPPPKCKGCVESVNGKAESN